MTFAPIKGKPTATPPRVSKPIPLGLGHWYPAWRTHSIFGNIVIARYKSVSLVMKWSFLYTQYTTGKHPVNIFWELWGVCVYVWYKVGGWWLQKFLFFENNTFEKNFCFVGWAKHKFCFLPCSQKKELKN